MWYLIPAIALGATLGTYLSALQQTDPPGDLITLQWIVISALAGAVGVLYWQYVKTRDANLQRLTEQQNLYYVALTANTEAMRELKHAIADIASLNKLDQRLAGLESRLEKRSEG